MRNALRILTLAAGAALVALAWSASAAEATSPGLTWVTRPDGLNCPSSASFGFADITCAATGSMADYSSVLVEVDSTTPVYFCGSNASADGGVNRTNASTSCVKRCSSSASCPGGASFVVDVKRQGGGKCISGAAADGGVITRVQCLR
jgi:hypothetical protein